MDHRINSNSGRHRQAGGGPCNQRMPQACRLSQVRRAIM